MRNTELHIDDDLSLTAYPHHKGHEVFVVVPGAAAKDVQALVVTRATQLTNRKLHPVIKGTECVFACMCEWLWLWVLKYICDMLCTCVILTTQGRGSSSECTPEVLAQPPPCTGNDGHLQPVCNTH